MTLKETRSTCPYCGVGCGVVIESQGDQITGVRGDPDHPANFGRLCTKGSTLHLTARQAVTRQTRLLQPMRRLQRGAAPRRSRGTRRWTTPAPSSPASSAITVPTPWASTSAASC
jgi:anaerobic selenocysteine-containing dehydrogenase